MEFVFRRSEWIAAQFADLFRRQPVKACRRIQPGSHRRAAQGKAGKRLQRVGDQPAVALQRGAPAGDLLRKADRRGVLQMRSAAFDHVGVFFLQPDKGGNQPVQRWEQTLPDGAYRRNVHGGGKGVVGGLGHIHVVVGV